MARATSLDNNIAIFPAESEYHRLSIMPSPFFGAARALMLQIAYPAAAQGIFDHNEFDTDSSKRAIRIFFGVFAIALGAHNVLQLILAITYLKPTRLYCPRPV